jgi:surface protein
MSYGKIYETTWWGNPIDGGWGDIYFDLTGTAETAFVFDVKTDNTGTSNNDQFTLPLVSSFNGVTAEVDWGDGSTDTITAYNQSEVTHTYASAGTYTIKINNALRGFKFDDGGDKLKLLNISNWGVLEIDGNSTFYGCGNMTCTATDAPTISTTNLTRTFRNCSSFNGAIGNWDVSSVTTMAEMFNSASSFNQPLNSWDVSNVVIVTNMFNLASSFNQPLNSWNTGNINDFRNMFSRNDAFDQDISSWDVTNSGNFINFMFGSDGFSVANYDALLVGWESQLVNNNISANFGGSKYTASSAAATARQALIDDHNWTIVDGGTA